MIIGIISDTHDKMQAIDDAFTLFQKEKVEHIIHCGDWKSAATLQYFMNAAHQIAVPVSAVLGNNDGDITNLKITPKIVGDFQLKEGVFELMLDDKRCVIYHGHHAPTLKKVMNSDKYDVVFLGHTHKPRISYSNATLNINPGSVAFSIPRSKDFIPTVALLNTKKMEAELRAVPVFKVLKDES